MKLDDRLNESGGHFGVEEQPSQVYGQMFQTVDGVVQECPEEESDSVSNNDACSDALASIKEAEAFSESVAEIDLTKQSVISMNYNEKLHNVTAISLTQ